MFFMKIQIITNIADIVKNLTTAKIDIQTLAVTLNKGTSEFAGTR